MSETKELTLLERAAVALGSSAYEVELREIVQTSKDIIIIKNADARDECHAALMRLVNIRGAIKKTGKEARDDATKFNKAVISEEDRLIEICEPEETRLRNLRDIWDDIIAKEKQAKIDAEIARIAMIKARIDYIRRTPMVQANYSSKKIGASIAALSTYVVEDLFEEFKEEVEEVIQDSIESLRVLFKAAKEKEDAAAKLLEDQVQIERQRVELAAAQNRLKEQQAGIDAQLEAIEREKLEKIQPVISAPIAAVVAQQMTLESAFDEPNESPGREAILDVLRDNFMADDETIIGWIKFITW